MAFSRGTFVVLYWLTLGCAAVGCGSMILAFATPYWIQSWRRVHSPFSNTGMWTICVSGYIKPMDPNLAAYVGCWWIHTSVFHEIANAIMPPWFRVVQMFVILTTLCNIAAFILIVLFRFANPRQALYGEKPWKMLFVNAFLLFAAALMVFIDSLIFAMKTTERTYMPRPYLNYLSWSYGFNVLSGFFSAFGGICVFLMAMMVQEERKDPDENIEDEDRKEGVDNAGVTATPPPPKFRTIAPEDQPMPRQVYGSAPDYSSVVYSDKPGRPYGDEPYTTAYVYNRRTAPIDSSATDTEV